jgi:hypothetical protein
MPAFPTDATCKSRVKTAFCSGRTLGFECVRGGCEYFQPPGSALLQIEEEMRGRHGLVAKRQPHGALDTVHMPRVLAGPVFFAVAELEKFIIRTLRRSHGRRRRPGASYASLVEKFVLTNNTRSRLVPVAFDSGLKMR